MMEQKVERNKEGDERFHLIS